jgi:hypothetical protein
LSRSQTALLGAPRLPCVAGIPRNGKKFHPRGLGTRQDHGHETKNMLKVWAKKRLPYIGLLAPPSTGRPTALVRCALPFYNPALCGPPLQGRCLARLGSMSSSCWQMHLQESRRDPGQRRKATELTIRETGWNKATKVLKRAEILPSFYAICASKTSYIESDGSWG